MSLVNNIHTNEKTSLPERAAKFFVTVSFSCFNFSRLDRILFSQSCNRKDCNNGN